MKTTKKLLAVLLAALMLLALCACGEESSAPTESSVVCTHENTEIKEVKVPTCTEEGITQKLCTDCGEVLLETKSPAVGHVWSPQIDENGNRVMACALCKQIFDQAEAVQ